LLSAGRPQGRASIARRRRPPDITSSLRTRRPHHDESRHSGIPFDPLLTSTMDYLHPAPVRRQPPLPVRPSSATPAAQH